jgi:membrane associated rhomboid family serine protease
MYEWFALWFPEGENFQVWQIVSHMFMHGGFAHLGFNMFGLWMFGGPVEQYLGKNKFLFLYFSAGLAAVLFQLGFHYFHLLPVQSELLATGLTNEEIIQMMSTNEQISGLSKVQLELLGNAFSVYREHFFTTMVGASGCVMGIIAAFGVMNPNAELMLIFLPIPVKAKYFIPGMILILDIAPMIMGKSFIGPDNIAYMAHIGGAIIGAFVMWYWKKNSFNKNRWN